VAARYEAATSAVKAVKAGADVILESPDIEARFAPSRKPSRAARSRISHQMLRQRILRAKAALGLNERRTVDSTKSIALFPILNSMPRAGDCGPLDHARTRERKALPIRNSQLLTITFTDDEKPCHHAAVYRGVAPQRSEGG